MTLAIMALFVCGLTINANAQVDQIKKDDPKKSETSVKPEEPKATSTLKTPAVKPQNTAKVTTTVKPQEPNNTSKVPTAVKPQEPKATSTVKTQKTAAQPVSKTPAIQKENELDKTLKDYEAAVEKCVKLFKNPKADPKDFQQSLTKAESLKKEMEQAKPKLDRTQVDRFNKATQELSVVYTKG